MCQIITKIKCRKLDPSRTHTAWKVVNNAGLQYGPVFNTKFTTNGWATFKRPRTYRGILYNFSGAGYHVYNTKQAALNYKYGLEDEQHYKVIKIQIKGQCLTFKKGKVVSSWRPWPNKKGI